MLNKRRGRHKGGVSCADDNAICDELARNEEVKEGVSDGEGQGGEENVCVVAMTEVRRGSRQGEGGGNDDALAPPSWPILRVDVAELWQRAGERCVGVWEMESHGRAASECPDRGSENP